MCIGSFEVHLPNELALIDQFQLASKSIADQGSS